MACQSPHTGTWRSHPGSQTQTLGICGTHPSDQLLVVQSPPAPIDLTCRSVKSRRRTPLEPKWQVVSSIRPTLPPKSHVHVTYTILVPSHNILGIVIIHYGNPYSPTRSNHCIAIIVTEGFEHGSREDKHNMHVYNLHAYNCNCTYYAYTYTCMHAMFVCVMYVMYVMHGLYVMYVMYVMYVSLSNV